MTRRQTRVAVDGEAWLINGVPTWRQRQYRGWSIEGLLLNSRMANAIFDDANPATRFLWRYPDTGRWDADRNTDEFVRALPVYRAHGLTAVTVNLQGGAPFGYYREDRFRELLAERQVACTDAELWRGLPGPASQPWHNSPFGADGALAQEAGGHLARLSRILQRTNELGMVVVLGIFYFGQDERLRDEAAVCRAVEETCGWVLQEGWRNVVIEINNECNVPRYEHDILQPHRVHELIARAQRVTHGGDRLLVGTSYGGGRIPDDTVCAASDFILLHGNGVTEPARIAAMVDQTRALPAYAGQPIAFTEDDHFAFDRPDNNFTAALSRRAGWGFFDPGSGAGGGLAPGNYTDGYQNVPVNWAINTPRKRAFFDLLRQVTGASRRRAAAARGAAVRPSTIVHPVRYDVVGKSGNIMVMPTIAPYGSWKSPITADLIVQDVVRLGAVQLDGDDVYWVEMRPADGARNVIVRRTPDGAVRDVTDAPFNVRTRVHEYGGRCFWVAAGVVWFANFADQRVYRQEPGAAPVAITPAGVDLRFGDGMLDWRRGRLVCVREDHRAADTEAVNAVVALDLAAGGAGEVLVSGSDFYGYPAVSPDGRRLAWLAWNHPHMPWDETELWVADLSAEGSAGAPRKVAGGRGESVFQPEWAPDGVLHFVSDRSGWWNLYRWPDGKREAEAMAPMRAEFGVPAWTLGSRTYAFESADRIACQYCEEGRWRLAVLDTRSKRLNPVETPYTEMSRGDIRAARGRVVLEAAAADLPSCLVSLDLGLDEDEDRRPGIAGQPVVPSRATRLRQSQEVTVGEAYLSAPRAIAFETSGGETAHAIYYPPCNPDFAGRPGERPPLLVQSHGGPTGAASTALSLGTQFWTSRGIAVVDVNYGGSSGYGTAYRRRLNGQWGIVDVDDCVNAALHLVRAGEVDGDRLLVTGGSAGGFTTLAALTFRDVFRAGASYYGISDLEALVRDTHKFESRYLDSLVGPYPERRDRYLERSPIHHTGRLSCPIILLQGLDDRIVPPNQAEMMVDALRRKGLPVAYLPFPGEQHGFRKAENAKRALEAELYFYSRILGFTPADTIEPVAIENL